MRDMLHEWASKAKKDRWCIKQRCKEEEAGGGGNREWAVEGDEKDTVKEMLSRREAERKWFEKRQLSPAVHVNRGYVPALALSFLCLSISISYLIVKACGTLKAELVPNTSLTCPREAQSNWYEGIISYYGHASLCTNPNPHHRTGTTGKHTHTHTQQLYICFTKLGSLC